MAQTRKAVIFFLSFFITLLATSLFFQLISPAIVDKDQSVMFNIISPLIATIGLVVFMLLQGLIRYLFYRKTLVSNTNLITANIYKFSFKERLLPYLFLILINLAPFLGTIIFNYTFLIRILIFIGAIIIIEILLKISNKKTNVFFQRNGILITGFDVRIEIPFGINMNIHNDSAFYNYNDIKDYIVLPDHIELNIINDYGKIEFMADEELKRQVTGIMMQNKIPVKKVME